MKPVAIVLAAFGASQPVALLGITRVLEHVRRAFPQNPVRLAFTSNQIRFKWQRRGQDPAWREANPNVPEEVLAIRGPLAAIADLQDAGHRRVIVQPLHIYAGEEYADLDSYVQGLRSIRATKPRWTPFDALVLGRPALGRPGPDFPYQADLARAAQALVKDAEAALVQGAALVYAGHGNPYYSTGVYQELEMILDQNHPGLAVAIGLVEGPLGKEHVLGRLKGWGVKKALLKPLMLVAGEHARSDLCGDDPDSWRSLFEQNGLEVLCELEGLGENPAWAELYVEHIKQAAQAAGLEL